MLKLSYLKLKDFICTAMSFSIRKALLLGSLSKYWH